mgnify:CR=1 FL=1
MHRHERDAFLKFFITYFFSVALLILIAGFFYFQQMKEGYLKAEDFSLITYARYIKIGDSSNTILVNIIINLLILITNI